MKNNNNTLMIMSVIFLFLLGIGFSMASFILAALGLFIVWVCYEYYQKDGKDKMRNDNLALIIFLILIILIVVFGTIIMLGYGIISGSYGNGFSGWIFTLLIVILLVAF